MPGSSNPTGKAALTPKVTGDNGGPFAGLLQPIHQAAYVATPTDTASLIVAVNALRAAMIAAGLMKAA